MDQLAEWGTVSDISGRWPGGTLRERLLMRVEKADGCWKWTGYHDEEGRPRFCIDDHPKYAYRLLYEELVAPVSDDLALDHVVCQNPSCMNPEHLEPVTRAVNTRRHYEQVTHCRKGHPLDEENRGRGKNGGWLCKACRRESQRRWYYQRTALPSGTETP